jgi:hypothetical protein
MTSVISSAHRKSPRYFDMHSQQNYRHETLDSASAAGRYADSEYRLLSGRSSVQLRPGAPDSITCGCTNTGTVCNSALLSVIPEGAAVIFRSRPAAYLGRHGSRHAILIRAHGAHGRKLRYVADGEITPSIPTAEHST